METVINSVYGTNYAPDGTITGTFQATVTDSTYMLLSHLSVQMDILNHSIYVTNNYLLFVSGCVALSTAVIMFLMGRKVVSPKSGD